MDVPKVCQFLAHCEAHDVPSALVTVCEVEGSSMRGPGSIMGVAQDGSIAGSLSGGCIEKAVITEALEALGKGASRVVRFGVGSPYLDIKLPCGGGLDLHFAPLGKGGFAKACSAACDQRQPFAIAVGPDGARFLSEWREPQFDPQAQTAIFGHWPQPLLQIIGHGAGVGALAQQSATFGCAVRVLTSDENMANDLSAQGFSATHLARANQIEALASDPWTANIFLFHDHDWEIALMEHALEQPHFYLGAMGGRKAHTMRSQTLGARGVSNEKLETIHAPIGLFHSSRDPYTLALSTLAEVIRSYETQFG